MVNTEVTSKIGDYIGDDDRRGKGTADLSHFRFRQDTCTPTGKNSVIRFAHKKFRLSEKHSTPPNNPGKQNYSPEEVAATPTSATLTFTKCHFGTDRFFASYTCQDTSGQELSQRSQQFCYSD
ncbi:MAG TPA: hypothetical protein VGK24_16470 [Candidatus Angelobacter sp.]|jgi:hypothetical protein